MAEQSVHVFGIRHHGPGSARALTRALDSLAPDVVLIEGPSDAEDSVVSLASSPEMELPVTLLIYDPANPLEAVFYPFAKFSPEWQAIQYALGRGVPARFIDLPYSAMLGARVPERPAADAGPAPAEPELRADPLAALARAAGYEDGDGERWWDRLVEQRRGGSAQDLFDAVLEAMTVLRENGDEAAPPVDRHREALREAHMRQQIGAALKAGRERVAVVCGAWHAPALAGPEVERLANQDRALLKGIGKKSKVQATWAPWTYERLTSASGYGAGVRSPAWYEFLWETCCDRGSDSAGENLATAWAIRVAGLLRGRDIDASSALVIEAVRLAQCLSSLRGHASPGLAEMNEAVQAVFCFGSDVPMRLIARELIVGERLGRVPAETPLTPLQKDFRDQQRHLRLPPEGGYRDLDLDLRKPTDLARSRLLHRLNLIGVTWGAIDSGREGKGTFHEFWRVQWSPEMEIALIAAGAWGSTIEQAAAARAGDIARRSDTISPITALLEDVMLADLPDAAAAALARLSDLAASAAEPLDLLTALPRLANIARYGDVRRTDVDAVLRIIDGLVIRAAVGLPGACASLDDDAAQAMYVAIVEANHAVHVLRNVEYEALWRQAILQVADLEPTNGLVAGRCVRLLYDERSISGDEAGRRMSLALSRAVDPARAAAWIDGFLRDSGTLIAHDSSLLALIDGWLCDLNPEHFLSALPLVRRTFSTFSKPDRTRIAERIGQGARTIEDRRAEGRAFSEAQAKAALPAVLALLGAKLTDDFLTEKGE